MTAIKKFLFDRSFDSLENDPDYYTVRPEGDFDQPADALGLDLKPQAPPPAPAPEPEPEPEPAPTFSEEQLVAVRDEAFAKGRMEGAAEAQTAFDRATTQVMSMVAESLRQLTDAAQHNAAGAQEQAIRVALAVLRKMTPTLAERHGQEEIEALLAETLATLFDEPRLIVRTGSERAAPLRAKLEAITDQADFRGEVRVMVDATMGPADCRIEWADGGTERDMERLWQEVDAALARNTLSAPEHGKTPAPEDPPPGAA